MTNTARKSFAELSVDTQRIAALLRDVETGAVISYADISRAIGRDVQLSARGNLITARRIVMRDGNIVFSVIKNTGLRRLDDNQKIASGYDDLKSAVPRHCRRIMRKITAITDFDSLPDEAKTQHNSALTISQTVIHMTKAKGLKALENRVAQMHGALTIAETVGLLKD